MPKTTPQGKFPFDKSQCTVELWESGNDPNEIYMYNIGVKAARGATESYTLRNNPKGDPLNYIEITGNPGSDIMKYNYIGIDFGNVGDGKKWYFVEGKTILNYPDYDPATGQHGNYAIGFKIRLDVWETYKDKLGSPTIHLNRVTTNSPGGWSDTTMMDSDIIPFSDEVYTHSDLTYSDWKAVVAWQSKKPTDQDNFIIDGMRTTMQFNDTGDLSDYLTGLDDLATGTPEETRIWSNYIVCNSYIVPSYMATENGGRSAQETLQLATPLTSQEHNRLNYYPYRRAFVCTVDGQNVEINAKRYFKDMLPTTIQLVVHHSMLPQPNSVIRITGDDDNSDDYVIFKSYPTIDMAGRDITPVTQLTEYAGSAVSAWGNYFGQKNMNRD